MAGHRSTDLPYTVKGQKQYRHPEHGMVELFDHPGLQMGIFSNGLIGGDYTWDGRSPLGVALNSLPQISIEQWAQVKKTLETLGYRNNVHQVYRLNANLKLHFWAHQIQAGTHGYSTKLAVLFGKDRARKRSLTSLCVMRLDPNWLHKQRNNVRSKTLLTVGVLISTTTRERL